MGRNMKMNSDHMAVGGLKTLRNVRCVCDCKKSTEEHLHSMSTR